MIMDYGTEDKTDTSFGFSHNVVSCRAGVAARLKVLLFVSCGEKDAAQHRGRPVRCADECHVIKLCSGLFYSAVFITQPVPSR